jgi:hypothetical protein
VSVEFQVSLKPHYDLCFNAPVAEFVRELRAFQRHYWIPVTNGSFRVGFFQLVGEDVRQVEPSSPGSGVTLPMQSLLVKGRQWKGAVAEYMNTHPDGINLCDLEAEYRSQVTGFMCWLGPALKCALEIPA